MPTKTQGHQSLQVTISGLSKAGRKNINQDVCGSFIPTNSSQRLKGVAAVIADGISSSEVSGEAAKTAVNTFLEDYYAAPESWTVQTAASKVITTINSWLYSHNDRTTPYDKNRGLVCTFSAIVIKGCSAHVFHIGDSRVFHLSQTGLKQITKDHRYAVSAEESYLSRALGADSDVDIDYIERSIQVGDIFIMTTDGVHEFLNNTKIQQIIAEHSDLNECAQVMVQSAYDAESDDNLSVQLLRVDELPSPNSVEFLQQAELTPLKQLNIGDEVDGFHILRNLHSSSRSYVYLAESADGQKVAIKAPTTEMLEQNEHVQRFILEEWYLKRISNKNVLGIFEQQQSKSALYVVTEYFEGKTLRQWMADNSGVRLEQIRDIIEQIISGLRAFHRMEMIHQDLRPENIMINEQSVVKIIDFGSVSAPGLEEAAVTAAGPLPGTFQYTAPEYLSGDLVSWRSDQFSLGVIAYEMLTGQLPYGTAVAGIRSRRDQSRLNYRSAREQTPQTPIWVDAALRKALHPDPVQRYDALSEFFSDMNTPNRDWRNQRHVPLMERYPVTFWKVTSGVLFMLVIALLIDKLS